MKAATGKPAGLYDIVYGEDAEGCAAFLLQDHLEPERKPLLSFPTEAQARSNAESLTRVMLPAYGDGGKAGGVIRADAFCEACGTTFSFPERHCTECGTAARAYAFRGVLVPV